MTNIRKISCNSYIYIFMFYKWLEIKVFSSKLAMGYLYHAVILLLVLFKRLQPIRLTIKQTSTHKHFSERKFSRNHRWSRQQDNRRIPIFLLVHHSVDQAPKDINHKPKQGGCIISLGLILCPSLLPIPTFGKHPLTLSYHFPF